MVRVTTLALRAVPDEVRDFGMMAGCTKRQLMWKVLVPTAKPDLMVGVNQVIMLSLNMVIIASMIGAGGLGFDVLASLRRLDIGAGLEAGIAIVVLAVALDRLSQAFARPRQSDEERQRPDNILHRYPRSFIVIAIAVLTLLAGYVLAPLQNYPEGLQITTGTFWAELVKTININYFDDLEAVKSFMLSNFMLPVKRFLTGIPWAWGWVLITAAGWYLGGLRLAQSHGDRLSVRCVCSDRHCDRYSHRPVFRIE